MNNPYEAPTKTSWLLPFILSLVLFIGSLGFGIWAYASRMDYKNNSDKKAAAAAEIAKKQNSTAKDNEFAEKEKLPLRTYNGPSAYGSIKLEFPKTWSAYINDSDSGTPLDGYFQPGFVPNIQDQAAFALRLQVVSTSYDQVLSQLDSQVKAGSLSVSPFKFAKVQSITGVRLEGKIISEKTGQMVIVPLRDKTLKVWTEGSQYIGDFNDNILPNLTFVP